MASVAFILRRFLCLPVAVETRCMSVGFAGARNRFEGIYFDSLERVLALDAFQRESHGSALVREMTTGADILRRCFIRSCGVERYALPHQAGIAIARERSSASHEALMYTMRIVAGEFSRQNIPKFRELGINIFRCHTNYNARMANPADRWTISAIKLR